MIKFIQHDPALHLRSFAQRAQSCSGLRCINNHTSGGMMARIRSSLFSVTVFVFLFSALSAAPAVTLPELTTRVEKLSRDEREALLIKGAKEEKEIMFYATTPVNQVAVLKKTFSARYPFVDLKHYYSPRQGILNKTVSEYRGKANITDVVMTDVSYGT